ncbi:MAG: hypothetical protein MUO60_08440 [Clostridiaceae bacterium]|nr:hypothetical protein [Clostridiaceae bacterium]
MNQKLLEYVDDVLLKISASKDFKMKLENELVRHIIVASENVEIEEVLSKLGSPKDLAYRMSRKLMSEISKELNKIFVEINEEMVKQSKAQDRREIAISESYDSDHHNNHGYNHHRIPGEYVREDNNVNIKLLYIPLIQICSQKERIRLPYVDESFFE